MLDLELPEYLEDKNQFNNIKCDNIEVELGSDVNSLDLFNGKITTNQLSWAQTKPTFKAEPTSLLQNNLPGKEVEFLLLDYIVSQCDFSSLQINDRSISEEFIVAKRQSKPEFKKMDSFETKIMSLETYNVITHRLCENFWLRPRMSDEECGQSLFSLMIRWVRKGYAQQGQTIFKNVGNALAQFHLKLGHHENEQNKFYSAIHGSLRPSNIFYDLMNHEVTLNQYNVSSQQTTQKDIKNDILSLLRDFSEKEKEMFKFELGSDYARETSHCVLDESRRNKYIKDRLQMLDDFFAAIKMGYTEAFKDAGYRCQIENSEVSVFLSSR